ncbi:T9SS type A sorting domain-containing protein [Arcicella sp. LKC2W]|nr:T9SS type A sorting domain-containing protein [Arcicella sp. LKC2W]MEA5458076.1 T9SS type A sorting domain-containing protein [Arcicella sp. LKC2W]
MQSHEAIIDFSTLKAGTYFLKLKAGEKSVTRKVVKF